MGLFRLMLAIAVVLSHISQLFPHGLPGAHVFSIPGQWAVKLFFIISGFYMALILHDKYSLQGKGLYLFWTNRLWRIFPCFWLVLALEVIGRILLPLPAVHAAGPLPIWHAMAADGQWPLMILGGLAQVFIFGNEVFSIFSYVPGEGMRWFTSTLPPESIRGWRFFLVGQSWSLSAELLFYLLVPLLCQLRIPWMLLLITLNICAASLCIGFLDYRTSAAMLDYFGPLQLGYFLMGMIAHRLHTQVKLPSLLNRAFQAGAMAFLVLLPFLGFLSHRIFFWGLVVATTVATPVLFQMTRNLKWDRLLGNLSYPVYLIHGLVFIPYLSAPWFRPGEPLTIYMGPLAVLLTLLASLAAYYLLDKPVDRWRQTRIAKFAGTRPEPKPQPKAEGMAEFGLRIPD